MKIIKYLLLIGFSTLLFFNSVLSQETSAEENSNKSKEVKGKDSQESEPAFKFSVFSISCRSNSRKALINNPPIISELKLDKTELTAKFSAENQSGNSDTANKLLVSVFTDAKDADGDVLIYKYEVSGGKIIGNNEKVIWDLTGTNAGNYTIKVAVDDGCGFCGNTITKTVMIKE